MRHHGLAFAALVILALAACNGGSGGPYAVPVPGTPLPANTSTVSFLVIVPPAGSSRTRPNVVVPSNATSVKFTVDSVNGTAYTGTPTTETLAASNSACQLVNGQLSCTFNLSAPVGTLIYTVTIYSGMTVIAEGNVSLTTTGGGTVSAPVTLSGTVAKIVISVTSGIEGVAASYPVTVQAEDSNGNTILGTYTSAITLTDTDSTGQTSVATSGSDSPPAGELISSSDTATLTYKGGTMSSSATISASASGLSPSNVTNATFNATTNYLAQSGSVTFGMTIVNEEQGFDGTPAPNPSPVPTVTTLPAVTIATGQTFGSANNLIGVSGLSAQDAINFSGMLANVVTAPTPPAPTSLSPSATSYYAWTPSSSSVALGLVGYSDPLNAAYPAITLLYAGGTLTQTCAQPYPQLLVLPFPATWNVYSGAGTCTTVFSDGLGDSDRYAYAGNGSYTDSYALTLGWAPCSCVYGNSTVTVDAAGDINYVMNNNYGQGSMSVSAPSPGATMMPVTFTPGTVPFMPAPAPSSAPNPWLAIGLPNGPPNPLLSDTMTSKGAIGSLPAACAVQSGLVPSSNPPLSEVDESIVLADPMDDYLPLYTTEMIRHFYLNGVGEICNENQTTADIFDGVVEGFYIGATGGPPVWSFQTTAGGAIAWYAGYDTDWDSYFSDTYTYITVTTLSAEAARVRSVASALPAAAQALTAATYAIAHAPMLNIKHMPRPHRQRPPFSR